MNLKDLAYAYKTKLTECGYKNTTVEIDEKESIIVVSYSGKETSMAESVMLLEKDYVTSKSSQSIDGLYDFVTVITVDETNQTPVTDMSRLNNKIHRINASSSYDHHMKKFIDSAKYFYNMTVTEAEYTELCRRRNHHMLEIYKLNSYVKVAKFHFKEQDIYVIYGANGNRKDLPPFKTCLPDLMHEETLLPVPDKLLALGIDRLQFSKLVRDTVYERTKYYQNLSQQFANMSDKDLFLLPNNILTGFDKKMIKLVKTKPFQYDIKLAIDYIKEKRGGRTLVSDSTPIESPQTGRPEIQLED